MTRGFFFQQTLLLAAALCAAAPQSLGAVPLPDIPARVFSVQAYGAVGNGTTDSTRAFQAAVAACVKAGGGIVKVPAGRFLTGPFTLASHLDLRLDAGAVILLEADPADYADPGARNKNGISAQDCEDVAVTGSGTIDGQGSLWWPRYRKTYVSPPGTPPLLHRPYMVAFLRCRRVLVQDVHIVNSPSFHLVPAQCRDVTIQNISITAPADSPNTDGIDPSGWNFLITNCKIDVGDDCIALKPTVKIDPALPSCRDFLITHCTFLHGHGLSIGGQTRGGLSGMTVEDCTFRDTQAGIRMKAPRGEGGLVENVTYDGLTMTDVKMPISISSYYPKLPVEPARDPAQPVGPLTPIWRHIQIRHLTATSGPSAGQIVGLPEMPVSDVTLTDVTLSAKKGLTVSHAEKLVLIRSRIIATTGPPIIDTEGGMQNAATSTTTTLTVAADGSGDFKTVQEAIAGVPDDSAARTVIHIKPGTYQGQIVVPASKTNLSFVGDDAKTTVLTYALNTNEPYPDTVSPFYRGAGVVVLGDGFQARNVTFQNTSGDHGQALALRVDGDRAVLRDCRLLGWQDTLMLNSHRQYLEDCYVEGRVDFIYGSASAWFETCEIHSKNGGHVTAASTPQEQPYGFVFHACALSGAPAPWVGPDGNVVNHGNAPPMADLGRPWRPFASVTFLDCVMGDHILPAGWDDWRSPDNQKTARFAEFGSAGPGANPARRVSWAKQLSSEEAAHITVSTVLGGLDHWNPAR